MTLWRRALSLRRCACGVRSLGGGAAPAAMAGCAAAGGASNAFGLRHAGRTPTLAAAASFSTSTRLSAPPLSTPFDLPDPRERFQPIREREAEPSGRGAERAPADESDERKAKWEAMSRGERWWHKQRGGDRQKAFDDFDAEEQIVRGWGSRARVRPVPPHQRDCIIETRHHIKIPPRKLNRLCTVLRRRPIAQARAQMHAHVLKASTVVGEVLDAAVKRAEESDWSLSTVIIGELIVGRGITVKKLRPWHGRGRFGIGISYRSHLTVVLRRLEPEEFDRRFGRRHKRTRAEARRLYFQRLVADAQAAASGEAPPKKPKARKWGARAVMPPPELMPKPWLIRSQMDITAVG